MNITLLGYYMSIGAVCVRNERHFAVSCNAFGDTGRLSIYYHQKQ